MSKTLREIAATLHDTEFPKQFTLELCAYCNLRCIMCPHPNMQRVKGFMSDELYRKCIDEIAAENLDSEVWLADHGESLIIGEKIFDHIHYAKEKGLTKVYLNTNGMLLTPAISHGIVQAGLDGMFFGLDAVTNKTYKKIRRGGNLDSVVRNIDSLLNEIYKNGHKKTAVWVQIIEMDENEDEVGAFTQFWLAKNVGVKIRRKLSWGGHIDSPKVQQVDEKRIPCPWIMNLIHILWDGRVGRCTGDIECNYPMGNVNETTISSIWRGPLRKERQIHLNYQFDQLNPQCQKCLDWKVGGAEKLSPATRYN